MTHVWSWFMQIRRNKLGQFCNYDVTTFGLTSQITSWWESLSWIHTKKADLHRIEAVWCRRSTLIFSEMCVTGLLKHVSYLFTHIKKGFIKDASKPIATLSLDVMLRVVKISMSYKIWVSKHTQKGEGTCAAAFRFLCKVGVAWILYATLP